MESVFQACILEAAAAGTTVLLSSHILAEVERLCDRVTIIRDGRAVQHGTLAELRSMTRTSIIVQTRRPVVTIESIDGVHNPRLAGDQLRFEVDNTALDAALRHLTDYGVESLVSQPPTLEELFLMHYGGHGDNGEAAVHDNAVDA
jgi:ABC-2 type transport system ATP-binding protein